MNVSAATLLIILAAAAAGGDQAAQAPSPHDLKIKSYASTMAIAKTASDTCADILIDTEQLKKLKDRFHMSEADRSKYIDELDAVFAKLRQAIADAPSQQAWCDATYRLYGPGGRMIPDLMQR